MFQQAEIYFGGSRFGRPSGARFRFPSRFKQFLVSILGKFRGPRNSPIMDPISGTKNDSFLFIFGPQKWVHFWPPETGPRNQPLLKIRRNQNLAPKIGPNLDPKTGTQKSEKNAKLGPKIMHTNGPKTWTQKLTKNGTPKNNPKKYPPNWTPKTGPKKKSKTWTPKTDLRN